MAWYTAAGGTTCLAAYDAIGASSLADSYTNEANPGTYTAAPGTAPTWAYGTGWTFNGTDQYLVLGTLSAATKPVSVIMRITPVSTGVGALQAPLASSVNGGLAVDTAWGTLAQKVRFLKMNLVNIGSSTSDAPASGTPVVLAVTYSAAGVWTHYRNGAADGTGTNDQTFSASTQWVSGQPSRFYKGTMAALAIYSGALSAADVATITTAMNALPVAAGSSGRRKLTSVPHYAGNVWRPGR